MLLQALARRAGLCLGSSARSSGRPAGPCSLARLSTDAPPGKRQTLDAVQGLFAESLLLLADAEESRETTYFVEDYEDAKTGVHEALDAYQELLAGLPEDARRSVREANDPKFNQLREQFSVLEESLINDE